MKKELTLNLCHVLESDINYKIGRFPDGEPTFEILDDLGNVHDTVKIKTRLKSAEDLLILALACDILDRWEIEYSIEITYLMTQRMDRVMDANRPFSLKVMYRFLNALGRHCEIHQLHSSRILQFPWNYDAGRPSTTCNKDFYNFLCNPDIICVFPDEHAKSHLPFAAKLNTKWATRGEITFKKKRDLNTGRILEMNPIVSEQPLQIDENTRFMVIDDLCDGGSTFKLVHKALKLIADIPVDIAVYHTVNPVGLQTLVENFDKVYTTNSYDDWKASYFVNQNPDSNKNLYITKII